MSRTVSFERSDVLDMWKTAVKPTKERLISDVKGFRDLTFVTQWNYNIPNEHLVVLLTTLKNISYISWAATFSSVERQLAY